MRQFIRIKDILTVAFERNHSPYMIFFQIFSKKTSLITFYDKIIFKLQLLSLNTCSNTKRENPPKTYFHIYYNVKLLLKIKVFIYKLLCFHNFNHMYLDKMSII